ncbi:hypothetical protein NAI60_10285, partial [Francisella tularensis subsp. holarctica]|nr:hypothetical protein [Francisella tularensis subsp. holarctica]
IKDNKDNHDIKDNKYTKDNKENKDNKDQQEQNEQNEQDNKVDQCQKELNNKETNKLLSMIVDDPGGLLKIKFARDYQRMI